MHPYIELAGIRIPSYGLCICTAVLLCAGLAFQRAGKQEVDRNDLLIILAVTIGLGMLGGGLLYLLVTYDLQTIYEQIVSGNFSFFRKQGTVFYGGLITGVVSAIVTSHILKFKIEELERCTVVYIPLGHAIGRIGCLLAGCCYGLPYQGFLATHTVFNSKLETYFPIQLIEAVFNVIIMAILLFYTKKERSRYSITCLYLIMYSLLRFVLEFFRGDIIRGSFLMFSTSQWISLGILVVALTIFCTKHIKEKETNSSYP